MPTTLARFKLRFLGPIGENLLAELANLFDGLGFRFVRGAVTARKSRTRKDYMRYGLDRKAVRRAVLRG